MTPRTYATPEAFKHALEARIRQATQTSRQDIARLRQLLVFDRFLARIASEFGDTVVVKGGIVLEFRLERARTTRDIDLRWTGSPERLLERLQHAARRDLADFFAFRVETDPDHPTMRGEGMVYDGHRFRAEARLAGRIYGGSFGVDVGFADVLSAEPEVITGSRFFEFVGIEPAKFRVYPRETHVAEKLHAYTLPRPRENSRVKDLPDLALLAQTGPFEGTQLRDAIVGTFEFRKTHRLPDRVPPAPPAWAKKYQQMATEDDLPWTDLAAVEEAVRAFLDPVLANHVEKWDPATWSWTMDRGDARAPGRK